MPFSRIFLSCSSVTQVTVLDGICAGIDCGLYAGGIAGVHSNLEMLPVCLFDYRCKFGELLDFHPPTP